MEVGRPWTSRTTGANACGLITCSLIASFWPMSSNFIILVFCRLSVRYEECPSSQCMLMYHACRAKEEDARRRADGIYSGQEKINQVAYRAKNNIQMTVNCTCFFGRKCVASVTDCFVILTGTGIRSVPCPSSSRRREKRRSIRQVRGRLECTRRHGDLFLAQALKIKIEWGPM